MNHYDVYGIGNALVDKEFEVEDSFFAEAGIEKGFMTLIEEDKQQQLLDLLASRYPLKKQAGGGSAANSLYALSQFGGKAFYSCKVANDEPGDFYMAELGDHNIETNLLPQRETGTTGRCVVMVTPDAERTMLTHLGISQYVSEQEQKTLSVKVPAGVDEGDRIRLTGEGQAGVNGGPPGDLYVQVHMRAHKLFVRDGRDLHCEIPISFVDAALGGELEVPTLDGRVKLKIPAETQTGKLFRLRGKGVTSVRGGPAGDLLCRVVVETPVKLTRRQKEILQEFQKIGESEGQQSPKMTSWFDGVKKFVDDLRA